MPLKGCQGKIIRLKNPGGRLFEEALFVLREDARPAPEGDMLAEANRILEENRLSSRGRAALPRLLPFLLGFGGASLLWLVLLLILLA